MRNIVLRADRQFSVKVGFEFKIDINTGLLKIESPDLGVDNFMEATSSEDGVLVLSLFLGEQDRDFYFQTSEKVEDLNLRVTSLHEDQDLKHDHEAKPHWFQRIWN